MISVVAISYEFVASVIAVSYNPVAGVVAVSHTLKASARSEREAQPLQGIGLPAEP